MTALCLLVLLLNVGLEPTLAGEIVFESSIRNADTKSDERTRTVIPVQAPSMALLTSSQPVQKTKSSSRDGTILPGTFSDAKGEYANVNSYAKKTTKGSKLLVISFDGFRNLYMAENRFLPWFEYFRSSGVYSDIVQSIFPSETFPNHYAIVTGRFAESHGIVANDMYDVKLQAHFTQKTTGIEWWNTTEPIWITARRQGIKTAVSFWPGSAAIWPENTTADYYRPIYDAKAPFEERIDEVIGHLANDGVQLGLLYYNRPDYEGHYNGVQSSAVASTLRELDWYLSYVLQHARRSGLGDDQLNIVVCADHGMTNVTNQLYLETYVNLDLIERVPSYGAITNLIPKPGSSNAVFESLKQGEKDSDGLFKVYRKNELPIEYHYSNNDRIHEIVIIAAIGVYISPDEASRYRKKATHGYDPRFSAMKPLFMARGPAFKRGGYVARKPFRTKDIYSIMTHIVGIEPYACNTSFADVAEIFCFDDCPVAAASRLGFTSLAVGLLLLTFLNFA